MPKQQPASPSRLVQQRREAIRSRWDAVREDRAQFVSPFHDLPVAEALSYLENLRRICEEGGRILNDRIGADKNIKCSGPRCGKDLSQLQPSGNPRWVAKKDFHDKVHPEIIRSIYFCSEGCHNEFVHKHAGSFGGDGR